MAGTWKWGERIKLRPLRPGELEEMEARFKQQDADRPHKSAITEEDVFESLLGPTGEIGLSSIDWPSEAYADRFLAWLSKRRVATDQNQSNEGT